MITLTICPPFHQGHFFLPVLPGNPCEDHLGPALCSPSVFCAGHIVERLRTGLPEDAHPAWFLSY